MPDDVGHRLLAQLLAGHIQKRKHRNNCRGNEQIFVFHFCVLVVPIAVDLIIDFLWNTKQKAGIGK